jgi:hypothetical protein
VGGVLAWAEQVITLELKRDGTDSPNYGELLADGIVIGQTLEDTDRHLEEGGEKLYGETAIPRGRYRIVLSYSYRFKRIMPEVLGVSTHTGVRIHGGNDEVDTLGCPLLGRVRTATGIKDCHDANEYLVDLLTYAAERNEDVWLEVS